MDPAFLLKGLALGFSVAAPVGQIGILCIRRTITEGRAYGFVSGLGAATADSMYGGVAAFGLTAVSGALVGQQGWLRLVGGLFLLYLGARIFMSKPPSNSTEVGRPSLLAAYVSTFLLTVTNPTTILSFAAVFAGLGLASSGSDYLSSGLMVLGVFLGSALWWLILSGVVGAIRGRLNRAALLWVNRLSGILIAGFGVAALVSLAM
jgi:threonine/homoserine/homoserine lactone efflux protein